MEEGREGGFKMQKALLLKRLMVISFKTAIQKYLTYPFDFYTRLLQTAISLIGNVGGIAIVYSNIDSVNGWEFYDSITVAGMFMLVQGIKNLFIGPSLSSISGLGGDLWTGNFDFIIMRTISSRLYISIKSWDPIAVIDILISIVMIVTSVILSGCSISVGGIVLFFFVFVLGFILLYSIMMIFASVAFWYLGTPLLWILNSVMEMGRYPVTFYPRVLRNVLTWILPIGFIITIPSQALIGKVDAMSLGLGMLVTMVFYLFSVWFYNLSVKKYSGASS